MVEHTIKSIDRSVAIKVVSASRGKALRAEPVVSFYEQGRVHHVGNFPILEDQMTQWDPNGSDPSPDRLDALVWACSELMVRQNAVSQYFGIEQTLATRAIASREGGVWPYDAANDPNYSKRARGE
jgi:hypothetical protein